MGVDYEGIGGVGLKITQKEIDAFIKAGIFTDEEWDQDENECIEKVGMLFSMSGDLFSGTNINFYLLVPGDTLPEVNGNVPKFIQDLADKGVIITENDIVVMSDILIF